MTDLTANARATLPPLVVALAERLGASGWWTRMHSDADIGRWALEVPEFAAWWRASNRVAEYVSFGIDDRSIRLAESVCDELELITYRANGDSVCADVDDCTVTFFEVAAGDRSGSLFESSVSLFGVEAPGFRDAVTDRMVDFDAFGSPTRCIAIGLDVITACEFVSPAVVLDWMVAAARDQFVSGRHPAGPFGMWLGQLTSAFRLEADWYTKGCGRLEAPAGMAPRAAAAFSALEQATRAVLALN